MKSTLVYGIGVLGTFFFDRKYLRPYYNNVLTWQRGLAAFAGLTIFSWTAIIGGKGSIPIDDYARMGLKYEGYLL